MEKRSRDASERCPRPAGASRDLIWISIVALVAFSVGVAFDVFARIHDRLERLSPVVADNVLAVLVILAAAFAVVSVRGLQRAEREGELREETERRFRALVEQVPAITYTWNPATSDDEVATTYISPQVGRILGFTPEEWLSSPTFWNEHIHSDDRAQVVEASARADREGTSFHEEYRVIAKDGRIVWVRDESWAVATDANGRPERMQGVMYDITQQKEAEQRTQDAENRYRTIVERVPTVAYTWDSADAPGEAPAPYISPQIHRLLGYTAQEWLEDPSMWEARVHPDDRRPTLQAWEDAATREETFTAEYRLRTSDGRWVWIRDEAVPVAVGSRGRPIYQGVMFDITEQKRAQERYRQLVEELPVVTYLASELDPDGNHRLPYVAPKIEQLTGVSAAEWMARPGTWTELIHPDDRDRVLEENRRTERTGERLEIEYRFLRRDGSIVWVRDTAVLVERDGAWPVWQGVIEDVTARHEAEARQRDAETRYRHLVERIPAAVYIDEVDEMATAVYISPQYERLTGYTPEERLAEPGLWVQMLHPDDREDVLAESGRTNASGAPFDLEYRIITKDGHTIWLHDHASLVEDQSGRLSWQGVLIDITERKLAEEALSRRDKILEASGFAAERFLNAPSWTDCLDDVLERAGEAATASRAYVFQNERRADGEPLMTQVFEWTAPGIEPTIDLDLTADVPYREGGFARWERLLADGGVITGLVGGFPESERGRLERQGILSIMVVPIFSSGEWWGFVGYDQCEEEREWQPAEIEALSLVANTLGAAIGRERAMRTLSETEARYQTLIEQIPAVTYMESAVEPSGKLYVSPQVRTILGFEQTGWSHEGWLRAIHQDDRERVLVEDLRTRENGEPFSCEYRLVRPDGVTVWLQDDAVLLRDGRGEPLYWQGVRFDVTARKEAEEHLREAERRYRTLVEQIPAITYIDECRSPDDPASWPTIYISPQVETILGYSPEEWRKDRELWGSLIHPDDVERSMEADRRHYETGEPLAIEIRLIAKDGSTHWIRDEAIMVRDDDGMPLWSQGILLDITERKLAEQHLHEAEERYRTLIETIPAATYIDTVEAASQAVYMSPQVEDIFGYTPEEWLRRPELWEQGVEPDDLPEVAAKIDRLNRDGTPYEAEYRFRRPDGRVVWVHDQAVVMRDEDGVPRFCQGVMFNITERREADEQLRETEERFRAIVEHVPSGIYVDVPDTSMQTMYVSPQVEDITGIPEDEWVDDPDSWVDALYPEDREDVLGRYLAAIAAEEPWSDEYRMRTRDGRTIWVHDETTFIHDDEGRHAMLLGVLSDITERKLAEHALRESEGREREAAERLRALDDMKNTFLAAVSHELRSPLTAILGLALTLERSEMVESDRNDLLERLAANARKLDRLLKDLLDIDRLNRGIVDPQYRMTDVGALSRRTIESLDALADRSIMVFAEPAVIAVDPAKVERIVENLLMNAARHTKSDSTIWLRVQPEDDGILIAVEDDGPGVPEELREVIFEPFRQGPTSSPHSPGTGIGLSLVGRFAELHGGRAWVEEREGGGASFRVFLPDPKALTSEHPQAPEDASTAGHAEAS
ncbi:MAG: PAS domain-containing protein [Actinomycetota bacterium]